MSFLILQLQLKLTFPARKKPTAFIVQCLTKTESEGDTTIGTRLRNIRTHYILPLIAFIKYLL